MFHAHGQREWNRRSVISVLLAVLVALEMAVQTIVHSMIVRNTPLEEYCTQRRACKSSISAPHNHLVALSGTYLPIERSRLHSCPT